MQVNMHEAKSQLSKLGEVAWKGETVIIAKSGTPYLDLIPHKANAKIRKPGRFKGQIKLSGNFNSEDPSINELFESDI